MSPYAFTRKGPVTDTNVSAYVTILFVIALYQLKRRSSYCSTLVSWPQRAYRSNRACLWGLGAEHNRAILPEGVNSTDDVTFDHAPKTTHPVQSLRMSFDRPPGSTVPPTSLDLSHNDIIGSFSSYFSYLLFVLCCSSRPQVLFYVDINIMCCLYFAILQNTQRNS